MKFKVLNIKPYISKKGVFRTRKDLLITVTERQFRSVTRFPVKWCFLSTFHVTSPLRGNNDFVSWFSLAGRRISQSLPMTMYMSDPLCRILPFWNILLNDSTKLLHKTFLRLGSWEYTYSQEYVSRPVFLRWWSCPFLFFVIPFV